MSISTIIDVERLVGVSSKDEADAKTVPRLASVRTLLLNVDYRPARLYPLSTVPWTTIMRWEMKNRYREKHQPDMNPCHVVIEYYPDLFVRGAHTEIQLAAVVRYPYFIKRYGRVSFTRHNVFLRDGFRCQYTGEKFPASKLTIDHVIPLAQGGKSTWENVVACGPELNWKKRDRTPQQAGLKLIRQPRQPTMDEINRQAHEHLTMDLSGAHPLWLPYLENAK